MRENKTESVRIDADVMRRARKYVDGTPMTIGGWISSEVRNVLNKVAPISKQSKKK